MTQETAAPPWGLDQAGPSGPAPTRHTAAACRGQAPSSARLLPKAAHTPGSLGALPSHPAAACPPCPAVHQASGVALWVLLVVLLLPQP